jgi:hypothetical protein
MEIQLVVSNQWHFDLRIFVKVVNLSNCNCRTWLTIQLLVMMI